MSAFPAWTNASGAPLSWRHYLAGRRHLAQAYARRSLQLAGAFAIAQTPDIQKHDQWWRDNMNQAGRS